MYRAKSEVSAVRKIRVQDLASLLPLCTCSEPWLHYGFVVVVGFLFFGGGGDTDREGAPDHCVRSGAG